MPFGLPSQPPEGHEFVESMDDVSCPVCGWDREEAASDPHSAFNAGVLLAVEQSEGSPYTAQSATSLLALYWRCPNPVPNPDGVPDATKRCDTFLTTEEDVTYGAMA